MQCFLRCPLVSIAALTVYLLVNVVGGALHHHCGVESSPGALASGSATDLQFQTGSATDDDDEEHCLICSVLQLARILPTPCYGETITVLIGEAFPTAAITLPHLLETATHPRAPPTL
jgi:hypothetical protein